MTSLLALLERDDTLRPTVCRECPFACDSLPGWLGEASWDPAAFLEPTRGGEFLLPCHLTVGNWRDQEAVAAAPRCRGHAHFLANSCKRPRREAAARLVEEAGRSAEALDAPAFFRRHHDAKLAAEHREARKRGGR